VFALIAADFFHALIFRPGANWDLQPFLQQRYCIRLVLEVVP
jgi:hypothetical protein